MHGGVRTYGRTVRTDLMVAVVVAPLGCCEPPPAPARSAPEPGSTVAEAAAPAPEPLAVPPPPRSLIPRAVGGRPGRRARLLCRVLRSPIAERLQRWSSPLPHAYSFARDRRVVPALRRLSAQSRPRRGETHARRQLFLFSRECERRAGHLQQLLEPRNVPGRRMRSAPDVPLLSRLMHGERDTRVIWRRVTRQPPLTSGASRFDAPFPGGAR